MGEILFFVVMFIFIGGMLFSYFHDKYAEKIMEIPNKNFVNYKFVTNRRNKKGLLYDELTVDNKKKLELLVWYQDRDPNLISKWDLNQYALNTITGKDGKVTTIRYIGKKKAVGSPKKRTIKKPKRNPDQDIIDELIKSGIPREKITKDMIARAKRLKNFNGGFNRPFGLGVN